MDAEDRARRDVVGEIYKDLFGPRLESPRSSSTPIVQWYLQYNYQQQDHYLLYITLDIIMAPIMESLPILQEKSIATATEYSVCNIHQSSYSKSYS